MLVPVAVVCRVPVPFVHVVDVVTVLHSLVVAIRPVITAVVAFVHDVSTARLALVPVAVVLAVGMAVVQVVDVIVVTYLDVSAIRTVPMFVILMGVVLCGSHDRLLLGTTLGLPERREGHPAYERNGGNSSRRSTHVSATSTFV